MTAIVAGGRDFVGTIKHEQWLIKTLRLFRVDEVVSGTCKGADTFGEIIAMKLKIKIKHFPACWGRYGKVAGPIRNNQMAEYADLCILFPGGKGTENMRKCAISQGIKVIEYKDA